LRGNHGICALTGGCGFLRGLSPSNEIDDVRRRQRRIGNIRGRELVQRSPHAECEIVLLDRRRHRYVHHRVSLSWVIEDDDTFLQLVAKIPIKQLAGRQVRPPGDYRIGGRTAHLHSNPTSDADL